MKNTMVDYTLRNEQGCVLDKIYLETSKGGIRKARAIFARRWSGRCKISADNGAHMAVYL